MTPRFKTKQLIIAAVAVILLVVTPILQLDAVKIQRAKLTKCIGGKYSSFVDAHFRNPDKLIPITDLGKDKSDKTLFEQLVQKPQDPKIDKSNEKRSSESESQDLDVELAVKSQDLDVRAALVMVIHQRFDIPNMLLSMTSYQQKFNDKYNYDWIIISYRALGSEQRETFTSLAGGSTVRFIDLKYMSEFLTYRPNTDKRRVRENRVRTNLPKSHRRFNAIQARHFTRFQSGHFYNLESLWNDYDYYWKVPSGSELQCMVNYDVFKYMKSNNIKYGWSLMTEEPELMFPTLLNRVKQYTQDSANNFLGEKSTTNNNFNFLLHNDTLADLARGELDPFWKLSPCSYDTEFEIASVEFFRSKQYQHFFNYLDNLNGIYYESWRESHIKTIATSLFLDTDEIHYFDDIAVEKPGASNCPTNPDFYIENKCTCNPLKQGQAFQVSSKWKGSFEVMASNECIDRWHQTLNKRQPLTHAASEDAVSFFSIFDTSSTE